MALAISWTITAPGWDRAEVLNRMSDLRRVAVSLPFGAVDDLRVSADEIGFSAHYYRGAESTPIVLRHDPTGSPPSSRINATMDGEPLAGGS